MNTRADPSAAPVAWRDPLIAASLLTRIPMPIDHAAAGARTACAVWAYPLVGAALGGAAGAVFLALLAAGAPSGAAAAAALAASLAATGALHEDGLADCADGFWGGWTVARRLDIMKDSRIGAFGASALCLALVARWSMITGFGDWRAVASLAAVEAVSRAPLGAMLRWGGRARETGMAAEAGTPPRASALASLGLAALLAFWLAGPPGLAALGGCGAACLAVWAMALRAIGRVTGDVLGAAQVAGGLVALPMLAP